MKKLAALTISSILSAATASAAVLGGGLAAGAENAPQKTFYPQTFEACALTDYAVGEDKYAFATDKKIAIFSGDKPEYYEFEVEIAALDYVDGKFCYKTTGGVVYDLNGNSLEHEITETELPVAIGGYSYLIKPDGVIETTDRTGTHVDVQGNFSNLKVFDGAVYAVNGNFLNKIIPPDKTETIAFEFADFSPTETITVGDTVTLLDAYNLEAPNFTILTDGEYLTEVKLDDKNFDKSTITPSDFFTVGKTYKVGEDEGFSANASALLLCETGNAHIIRLGDKFYIKLASAAVTQRQLSQPQFTSAQINVPADYIYSAPCVSSPCKTYKAAWGQSVKVLGCALKSTNPELDNDYYKIAFTDADGNVLRDENGKDITGYVPFAFVFEKQENNDENKTDDPSPDTSNNIKTVVLILVVIVLALSAVGYVTYVFTSDKKRKTKK